MQIPEELRQMIEKAHANTSRSYADIRIMNFECGCVLAAVGSHVTEMKKVCSRHKT